MPHAEITVTQYLRPNGTPTTITGEVDISEKAIAMLPEMVLSAEVLMSGQVAVYARKKTDEEEDELMAVTSNDDSVRIKMAEIIEKVAARAERAGVV